MKINDEKWAELRTAVELDDAEQFSKLIQEWARIAVAHERSHARRCDAVRSRERGDGLFFAWDRTHR